MRLILWDLFGLVWIILGIIAFILQPVIGIDAKDTYLIVLNPTTSLNIVIIGTLFRIYVAIMSYHTDKEVDDKRDIS